MSITIVLCKFVIPPSLQPRATFGSPHNSLLCLYELHRMLFVCLFIEFVGGAYHNTHVEVTSHLPLCPHQGQTF